MTTTPSPAGNQPDPSEHPQPGREHLLQSAKTALAAGQDEKVVIACLLHDISNGPNNFL